MIVMVIIINHIKREYSGLLTLIPSHLDTALRGRRALNVLIALNALMPPISMLSIIRPTIDICQQYKYFSVS